MPEPLTPRQAEVLQRVTSIIRRRGEPPSVRELADLEGLGSPSNAHRYLVELESKGYLDVRRTKSYIDLPVTTRDADSVRLTDLQARVYDFVCQAVSNWGYAPSVREINEEVGASVGGVYKALQAIEEKGLLKLHRDRQYGISLIDPDPGKLYPLQVQRVPCEASSFLSPIEGEARTISLPLSALLRSFKEADAPFIYGIELRDDRGLQGYSAGDLFLVDRRLTPNPGDIATVEFRDRIIIRYWHRRVSGDILLSARNEKMKGESERNKNLAEDIVLDPDDLVAYGVAVASIRRGLR